MIDPRFLNKAGRRIVDAAKTRAGRGQTVAPLVLIGAWYLLSWLDDVWLGIYVTWWAVTQ